MKKDEFIKTVSKIDQTFEDEFKAEYNSPELIWPLIEKMFDVDYDEAEDFLRNKGIHHHPYVDATNFGESFDVAALMVEFVKQLTI